MKDMDNMEETIKKGLNFTAGAEMRARILNDILQAQEKSKKAKPAPPALRSPAVLGEAGSVVEGSAFTEPGIWRIVGKNPITKIAAAALIILGISFFVIHLGPGERVDTADVSTVTRSPAELLSVVSLNMAYRRGGIEAIERQCDEAIEKLGPRQAKITVKKLLADFNGT